MIVKHVTDDALSVAAAAANKELAAAVAAYDQRILRSLRQITQSIEQYSSLLATTWKITAPQLICLMEIAHYGPINATSISRAVHLSPSTVVGIIDRLEEKGWVTRVRDRKDRRVIDVSATEAGKRLLEQAPSPLQQTLADALTELPELEQAMIASSLERIVTLMRSPAVHTAPMMVAVPIIPSEPRS